MDPQRGEAATKHHIAAVLPAVTLRQKRCVPIWNFFADREESDRLWHGYAAALKTLRSLVKAINITISWDPHCGMPGELMCMKMQPIRVFY